MKINVTSDVVAFQKKLNAFATSQVPFAVSKALNATALQIQRAGLTNIEKDFTVRRRPFIQRLLKIERGGFATKQNLRAELGIQGPRSDLLAKFEVGGLKTPTNGIVYGGRKYLAIPRTGSPAKPRPTSVTPDSLRPSALLGKTGALTQRGFIRKTKRGGLAIFGVDRVDEARAQQARNQVRYGAGAYRRTRGARGQYVSAGRAYLPATRQQMKSLVRRARPTAFYFLDASVKIDDRLHLIETAQAVVRSGFAANLRASFREAIRTAR